MASTPEHFAALGRPVDRSLFSLPVLQLAPALIGKVLVHWHEQGPLAGRIVETEAYRGPQDRAAHSFGGRRTKRTEAMFAEAGTVYMFLLYGMHWAFNVVAGPPDVPQAVLVRALEPVELGTGFHTLVRMAKRRGLPIGKREIANGPGKLCAALGLNGQHYGLRIWDDTTRAAPTSGSVSLLDGSRGPIGRSARINVDYAGAWSARPWRFFERGNRWVSVSPRE